MGWGVGGAIQEETTFSRRLRHTIIEYVLILKEQEDMNFVLLI